jgi:hypothetical protein
MTYHSNGPPRHYTTARRTTMSSSAHLILMLFLGLVQQSFAIDSECLSYMNDTDTNQNGRIEQDEYVVFVDQLADGAFHKFFLSTFDELPGEVRDNFFISACAECYDDPAAVCDCDPSEGIEMHGLQREKIVNNDLRTRLDELCHQTRYAIANSQGKTLEPTPKPVVMFQLRQAVTAAPTPSYYQCQIAITIADVDRSNVLTEEEYVAFLNRLSQNQFPSTGFVLLPSFLQTIYQDLSGGEGIVVTGAKPGEDPSVEQTAHLESICQVVGDAINFVLIGETPPSAQIGTAAPVASQNAEGTAAPVAGGTTTPAAAGTPAPVAAGTKAPIPAGTPAPVATGTKAPIPAGTPAPVAAGTPAPVASPPVVPGTAAPVALPIPPTVVSGTTAPNVAPGVATTIASISPSTATPNSAPAVEMAPAAAPVESTTLAPTTSPVQALTGAEPTIDLPACIALIAAADANLDEELLRKDYIVFLGSLSKNDTFSAMVFTALPEVLQTNYNALSGAATGKGIIVTGARQDQNSTAEQQAFLGRVCSDTIAALNSRPVTTTSTLAPMSPPATLPPSGLSPVSSLTDSPVLISEPQTSAPTTATMTIAPSLEATVASTTSVGPNGQVNGTVVNGTVTFVIYNAYGFTAKALRFGGIRNSLRRSMNEMAKEIINVPQRPTPRPVTQGSTQSNSNARLRRRRRLLVTYYNLSASINEMLDETCPENFPEQFLCIAVNASFGIVVGKDDFIQNPGEFYSAKMQDAIEKGRLQYYLKLDTPDSPIAIENGADVGRYEPFLLGFFTVADEGFWTTSTLLSICYSSVFLCLCCTCFCFLNRGRKAPEESKEDAPISAESAPPPKKKGRKSPAEKAKDAKKRETERKKQEAEAKKQAKRAEAESKKQAKQTSKNTVNTTSGGMFDSMTSGATGMKNQMAMAAMKAKIGM